MEVWYKVCPYRKEKRERERKKEGESNATSCRSPPEGNIILNEKNANSYRSRQLLQQTKLLIYF